MKRKLVAMTMACTLAATALTGCGGSSNGGSSSAADTKTDSAAAESTAAETTASDAEGSVYYLNFKPEQDQQWQDLAKAYTEETGVPVTVVTAASGSFDGKNLINLHAFKSAFEFFSHLIKQLNIHLVI